MAGRQYNRTTHAVYTAASTEERQTLLSNLKTQRRELQKIEAAIRATIPGGDPTVELADVAKAQAALDPGTLLISYLVRPEETIIFTLTHEGPLEVHREKLTRTVLKRYLSRFSAQIDRSNPQREKDWLSTEDFQAALGVNQWLADRLLTPITQEIESADRLLIIPDSQLHALPFAALVRQGPNGPLQYLIEQKPIHIASSASVYSRLKRCQPRRGPTTESPEEQPLALAAFGDPCYPKSLVEQKLTDQGPPSQPKTFQEPTKTASHTVLNTITRLKRLDHSGHEVRTIREFYAATGEAKAFTGTDASEANLKREAPCAQVVHIAAHAITEPERPFDSFIALSVNENLADDTDEIDLLQAWELFDGNPRLNADLVVLSACQSALGGDHGGEGIISLARAFQVAGARTVVASLWLVADDSTAELMIRFHKYHLAGHPKDQALQQAQIDLIRGPVKVKGDDDGQEVEKDFTAPYHWAAFQLFGDWQ